MSSKAPKTIWLLDVDGVINAISHNPPNTWPKESWIQTKVEAGGELWPIMAAEPILDLIREVAEKDKVEIRWHTTWQSEANTKFAKSLNLPEFMVQEAPEFFMSDYATRRQWWKWFAVRRLLDDGNFILWTDDDIDKNLVAKNATYFNSLFISPQTVLGLTPKHVKQIRGFLGL